MRFNLSAWALQNRQIVVYLMLLLALVGALSYSKLGQSEDPPFTFKAMVIQTQWPGATAEEVSRQVTERIEKKLMETGEYERIVSFSRPGESNVTFMARDSMRSKDIPDLWYQIRKKIGDIRHTLPPGVQGPFFNDEFGTTFGNIYALTGEGFDYAILKDYADRIQLQLQRVKNVGKVELIGLQDEKIWIELSNVKLATLGVPLEAVRQALEAQNAVSAAGFVETISDRVQLRVTGSFETVKEIRDFPIRVAGRTFRIGDVAEVHRGFNDPPAPRMRFMGEPAIGLAVSMKSGGDILILGEALQQEFARLQQELPAGMQLRKVSDQPAAVKTSVGEFVKVLIEALVIVLLVSFFSLGVRTGLVVALSIPLVLAMTFAAMNYLDIGLHKISLGALVLALGLMVDDAIIAVEMMAIKMEQGYDRLRAASFAWTSTAFPMLTGTLITAAGFLPIATANSSTGEYTRSIFQVVAISLIASWIAAVMFVPLIGEKLLPDMAKAHKQSGGDGHDPYATPFYQRVRRVVTFCVRRRKTVILLTLVIFAAAVVLFRLVPQQFFPASGRLELMVDLKLAEGASLKATEAEVARLEQMLKERAGIDNYVAYVGTGSPRFYLPLDQQLPATSFAQFVVLADSIESREALRSWLIERMREDFPSLRGRVTRLENGPPVGYPVQFRVTGEHIDVVRGLARQVAAKVGENPHVANVHLDWQEPSKMVRLNVDQDRARALGVSTAELSGFLRRTFIGNSVSQFREDNELIEILLRGTERERLELSMLPSLAIPTESGRSVPLSQVATLEYGFEEGVIWHRNRLPTVTVRADVYGDEQPAALVRQIEPTLADVRAQLPGGYLLEVGGTVEDSERGQRSVNAGLPLFVIVVMTLLMAQLKSFSRSAMVFLTAPLGIIGVALFLLLFGQPFGFVAMLGTIALSGMIMRNSVILVDQIEQDIGAGQARFSAIVEATVRRFRPIVLTALASVLAMIPLSRSIFFGPMAVAIMGGLIVATALTLLFLPALYAAWFRVREGEASAH
ncbi:MULTISPECIES: efflux RND transporter permease subunit [Stutzerimonas]|jgi:multidrug efflux pump|uniref:RND efflux transporter n=1 Tax=Stutzerimonas stutzeri (strain ATCC 17588 / DSM 5190 / CCUG 11256 / JCM 5965 / LMG 11199 / NBRC 14165 / NCIMB 11358 / Stanier 221) TaxID=96563 RepID=A0A4P1S8M4_STUS2|nr:MULTISPECIES: efflux RND transporter permease subunit [Stutzerimonas]MBW8335070.1 efflux RND transporter permease subunit [Pseudomonas sp.]MCJ0878140.1 efflux RND transporter permease subunit [Pseudomonas sp. JI-2]NMY64326.1 efflux RND transporter permease subunit [Pseudomonas sp. WS 5018]AEA84737.1 RND efflux transporter [Stutzerimonas stutzeri DSM 4166]AEJ06003.1 RND efflux transporter [Stutzerimonas stutzeri]